MLAQQIWCRKEMSTFFADTIAFETIFPRKTIVLLSPGNIMKNISSLLYLLASNNRVDANEM